MTTYTVQPAERPWQFSIFWIFSLAGAALIMIAFLIGLFQLTPVAQSYWAGHSKLERDCAGVSLIGEGLAAQCEEAGLDVDQLGAELTPALVTLTSVPRWLEPLIFVGVASFMFGIALEFSSIPKLLQNRAQVMRVAYEDIVSQ